MSLKPFSQEEIVQMLADEQAEDNLPALSVKEFTQKHKAPALWDVAEVANFAQKIADETKQTQVILFARVRLVCRPGSTAAHAVVNWAQDHQTRRDAAYEQELALAKASKEGA